MAQFEGWSANHILIAGIVRVRLAYGGCIPIPNFFLGGPVGALVVTGRSVVNFNGVFRPVLAAQIEEELGEVVLIVLPVEQF